jgi:uncharacterized protein (TIGR02147 family)
MTIFEIDKYRDLLNFQIERHGNSRGYKSLLAAAAGSQSSHISQVLHGFVHLTVEQAYGIAKFWRFDAEATGYFIYLVQRERSTSSEYSQFLTEEINKIRTKKSRLSESVDSPNILSNVEGSRYYASWVLPAIHMLVTIPKFQNVQDLSTKLKLAERVIDQAIADLEKLNLVKRDGSAITPTLKNIHISSDSPWNVSYHSVWRNQANLRMQQEAVGANVHFTTLYSMSEKDAQKLKRMVLDFIHSTREVALPSKEEKVVCFTCDLFEI